MKCNYRNKAFTLAEVLITLGIIGVVAALTLPALIKNHQKQTFVNQLKKVVNTLENAARMAVAQEGVSSFKESEFYCKFLDFYVCGEEKELSKVEEIAKKYFKYVSFEANFAREHHKKDLNGNNVSLFGSEMVLADGAVVVTSSFNDNSGYFVDVNGDKGPNVVGRDVFLIHLNADGIVEEHGTMGGYGYICKNISESQYLEKGCYYSKIIADGWKMNY